MNTCFQVEICLKIRGKVDVIPGQSGHLSVGMLTLFRRKVGTGLD